MAQKLRKQEADAIKAIDDLLQLFEKYSVPVTWAVVGKVFLDHPEIIEKIRSSRVPHEIAYHSFSHVLFSECGYERAEAEILEGIKLGADFGIDFTSFVFPENNIAHTQLLKKYGFQIYRGANFLDRNVNKNLLILEKNAVLSKIIAPPVRPMLKDGIWEIPSSMWFYDRFPYALTLIYRTKQGIKRAIKENKVFHLFMHPEELLIKPQLIDKLEEVLRYVEIKKNQNKIYPITMGGLIDFWKLRVSNDDEL